MKMILRHILVFGIFLTALCAQSYGALSKVTVKGKSYYRYDVKRGDTMYGIARELGWDVVRLLAANPGEMSTLDKGGVVYYPVEIEEKDAGNKPAAAGESAATGEIRHEIMRGETLSAISRIYGVPIATLIELNPGSAEGIRTGESLLISRGKTLKTDEGETYHIINPGETIYGLSRQAGISVSSLMEANPGISETNFRAGQTIRIPARGTGVKTEKREFDEPVLKGFRNYKVVKGDTWKSIAVAHSIDEQDLRDANKGSELKPKNYIGLPLIRMQRVSREITATDPREEEPGGIGDIYREVHGVEEVVAHPEVRLAVVSDEPSEKRDRQFMRGVLVAVNELKNSGTKIALKFIDGKEQGASCTDELKAFRPSMVISTAESRFPEWLATYAETDKVPVVNTLDVKNKYFEDNPYVIQLITPSEYFNDEIAAWLHKEYAGSSLVFTGEEDSEDALAASLKSVWEPDRVRSRSVEDLRTMQLNEKGKYLLYSYPVKRAEVSDFLDAVSEAKAKASMATVSVVGRPNWIVFDESLSAKYHQNNVMIPARFYMEREARNNSRFAADYKEMFGQEVANTFPVYSAMGYDVANYFITNLAATGGDLNALPESKGTLQSDFMLKRPSNWSGPLNKASFIVRFTPFDSVEKVVVK